VGRPGGIPVGLYPLRQPTQIPRGVARAVHLFDQQLGLVQQVAIRAVRGRQVLGRVHPPSLHPDTRNRLRIGWAT